MLEIDGLVGAVTAMYSCVASTATNATAAAAAAAAISAPVFLQLAVGIARPRRNRCPSHLRSIESYSSKVSDRVV